MLLVESPVQWPGVHAIVGIQASRDNWALPMEATGSAGGLTSSMPKSTGRAGGFHSKRSRWQGAECPGRDWRFLEDFAAELFRAAINLPPASISFRPPRTDS
jgi:hypothetical protein